MDILTHNGTCVNRFANLTPEEAVILAFLDCDRPDLGIETDPASWGPEADERWETDEIPDPFGDGPLPGEAPESPLSDEFDLVEVEDWQPDPRDEAEAVRMFAPEEDVIMEDDERPRDTWTPSRIAAHEYEHQELRR